MKHLRAIIALLTLTATSAHAASPRKECVAAAENGQQLRLSGKLLEAHQQFARCTPRSCPSVVRRDCARWLEEVDSSTPTISVRLEDGSGNEVVSGTVRVDGEPVVPQGPATPIDPGVHRFVWTRSDADDVLLEAVIREGERNRVITLRAPASRVATASAAVKPIPEAPRSALVKRNSAVPWIIGGLGLAAAGAGGALWAIGLDQRSSMAGTCATTHSCSDADVDGSRTKLIIGDVLVGVGVVAIVAGIYLALRRDTSPTGPAAGQQASPIPSIFSAMTAATSF